jgi:hypothetical protein
MVRIKQGIWVSNVNLARKNKLWKSTAMITSPWSPNDMTQFLEHFFYSPDAFLISEITQEDAKSGEIRAVCKAGTAWLVAPYQRGSEAKHPRHISGGDLVMLTGSLGSLHAYFFHDCKWHDGWVGFGNRIEKAEFHNLGRIDLPLELFSKEVKVRRGAKRTLISYEFRFTQGDKLIYTSQQTALFVKPALSEAH